MYCAFQLCEVVWFVSSSETCTCAAVFSSLFPPCGWSFALSFFVQSIMTSRQTNNSFRVAFSAVAVSATTSLTCSFARSRGSHQSSCSSGRAGFAKATRSCDPEFRPLFCCWFLIRIVEWLALIFPQGLAFSLPSQAPGLKVGPFLLLRLLLCQPLMFQCWCSFRPRHMLLVAFLPKCLHRTATP